VAAERLAIPLVQSGAGPRRLERTAAA